MVNYISGLAFVVLLLLGLGGTYAVAQDRPAAAAVFLLAWLFLDIVVSSSIRLAAQWEKAVVFRLGKFHCMKGPGLFMIVPLVDQIRMMDMGGLSVDFSSQEVMMLVNVTDVVVCVLF